MFFGQRVLEPDSGAVCAVAVGLRLVLATLLGMLVGCLLVQVDGALVGALLGPPGLGQPPDHGGEVGHGRPAAGQDVLGHRIDRARGGAGAEPQPLKGGRLVDVLVDHQGALGLLDQHPGAEGDLELFGQPILDLGLGGRAEQAGHHAGVGWRALISLWFQSRGSAA